MASNTLGKRKTREEEPSTHGSTLFVSNLPYTATSVDLQTLFSDIAPVRSAFVVSEQGTGVSKGVGYVSFAIKEDAEAAYENLSTDGISLVGRKLRIQWADQKPLEKGGSGEVAKKEPKTRPPPRPQPPRVPHDPLAIRTIIVSGLPPSLDSKVLWKKIRKYEGAEKVDWPIKSESGSEDPSTAHVLFTTAGSASDAVNKLHAHVFKGCLLSVTLKKRRDTLSKAAVQPLAGESKNGDASGKVAMPSHASRLIVRNLPFNASEQDLRAVFLPYGPIYSIHIPTAEASADAKNEEDGPSEDTTPKIVRTKGFAFVWMLSKKDAEKAIEGCNGMVVRAGTAKALVLDKQKKKKQKRLEKKMQADVIEREGEIAGEGGDDEPVDDKRATERVIAVDWALSKEKWKEEKAKIEDLRKDGDQDVEMAGSSESESEVDNEDSSSNSDDESALGLHEDGGSDAEEDETEQATPVKPQLPPPETGTTLFVRNVPFNATEDELRTLFRAFGPLRYARITLDPVTGRSRGTGFACFWNIEDADRVVQQSEMLRVETTGVTTLAKKNPFTLPSILTPDPSSSLAQSLVLHGRTLDVIRAVTRDEAGKLKEVGEKAREKADKRNMYLLREGVILPNTPAAEFLTPADIEKRTSSFNARRTLLKSNPSLFISKTRLSVRHIPIFVTERMLKRLSLHAARTFEDEVKAGKRVPLTEDELADIEEPKEEGAEPEAETKSKKRGKFASRRTGVKQTKIVRIAERVDPITGKGRSKGYGFVEMEKHSDALRVLRWANNNPDVGPLFEEWWKEELADLMKIEKAKKEDKDDAKIKRMKDEIESGGTRKSKGTMIVEFSIENVQVVQRRNAAQKDRLNPLNDAKKLEKHMRQKLVLAKPVESSLQTGKIKTEKLEERSPKRRRVAEDTPKPAAETVTGGQNLGSLIGRKRRERKTGKKGSH